MGTKWALTRRLKPSDIDIESIPWDVFLRDHFRWVQGQHVSIIAPTNVGKSVLMCELQKLRQYVVVVGVKPEDDTLEQLRRPAFGGYQEMTKMPPVGKNGPTQPHVLLWPKLKRPTDYGWQSQVIRTAMLEIWQERSWCLAVDEMGYLVRTLGLRTLVEQFWEQGRSLNISMLAATQRPRHVPLTMYSSASHLFLGGTNDTEDLRRLGGLNGADTAMVRIILQNLPSKLSHELLYVDARTGFMCIVKAPFNPSRR